MICILKTCNKGLWVAALLIVAVTCRAQNEFENAKIITLNGNNQIVQNPNTFFEVFTDTFDLFSRFDIVEAPFRLTKSNRINFGVNDFDNWVRFSVHGKTDESILLKIDNAQLHELELYRDEGGRLSLLERTGQKYPFDQRTFKSGKFVMELPASKREASTYYLKIRGHHQLNVPFTLSSELNIVSVLIREQLLMGLYLGLMFAMLFYNLFIYFSVRMPGYIYYVLYIFFVAAVQSALAGLNFKYITSQVPEVESFSLFILNPLTALFSVLFFLDFVDIKKYSKILYYVVLGGLSLYLIQFIFTFSGFYHTAYTMMNSFAFILAIILLFSAGYAVFKGSRQAKFFLGAWIFFLVSVILFVLTDEGILAYNIFTKNSLRAGSASAALLLAFGLADNINLIRRQNEKNRLRALEASRENERLIRNRKIELELQVDERTRELQISNEDLSKALKELRETQTQLVNQEKMASLGQLTAGIAHEINNPINFVTSNVKPVKRDIDDIFEILDDFIALNGGSDYDDKIEQINQKIEDYELSYIRNEIFQLLNGIEEGAGRTAEIVRGLKVFSRAEEQDVKSVDLVEGLESTLTLLNNTTKNAVKITRKYESIPRVECYPGKMNQVFMNLLSNAVYAVKARHGEDNGGEIVVRARYIDDNVEFKIEDNGYGIPEEKLSKIFDPFFTTKDPGEGTGLGLSISQSIIAKHKGKLDVWSKRNEGTIFTITVPVKMKADELS